jgi:hypothetical protein
MRPRSRASRIALACLLPASALWACAQLLNVDGIDIEPVAVDAGAAGGGAPAPTCQAGAFRCEGAALQLCEQGSTGFRTVRVCSSAELCCSSPDLCAGQPGCLAPACSEGELRCDGAVLQGCNAGHTAFVPLDRCASATQCNATLGRCTDEPCDASTREHQCNGNNYEECLPDRSEWTLSETCPTYGLCSTEAPAGCAPSECRIGGAGSLLSPYQCVSGNLLRCNDAQTDWEFVETCLNTANCNALIEPLQGSPYAPVMSTAMLRSLGCSAPGCAPGRYLCDGANLMLCGANRTGYLDRIDTCMTARHCDATAGRCSVAPCSVGVHQCSGDEYQVCTELGWQVEKRCDANAPCDTRSGCQPAQCRANEYRCTGDLLERCNVERTGWIPVETCATEALCDVAAKRCDKPVCAPGESRCAPTGQLQRCNPERDGYSTQSDCAVLANLAPGVDASAACDPSAAGRCLAVASCENGALRCNGAELERCRDNAFHPFARCSTPAQCDAVNGGCIAPVCEPGEYRCVTPGAPPTPVEDTGQRRGATLEVCNDAGTAFQTVRACAPLELCDDAHGQCDICDAARPLACSGTALEVCTADGQERTLYKVCAQGCVEAGTQGASRTTCLEDMATSTP